MKLNAIRDFAKLKHAGQKRDDGSDYFENHIVPVADLVHGWYKNPLITAVAYAHDLLEDTDATLDELVALGMDVKQRYAVEQLTNIKGEKPIDKYIRWGGLESFARIVKCADRAHNLESALGVWSEDRVVKYAKEGRLMLTLWDEFEQTSPNLCLANAVSKVMNYYAK